MEIKRDWAGRPTEIKTSDGKRGKSFVLFFKDNSGYWNEENKLDMDDVPAICGFLKFWEENLTKQYWEYQKEKAEQRRKSIIVPRDKSYDPYKDLDKRAFDKDITDRHPEEKQPELKEEVDNNG